MQLEDHEGDILRKARQAAGVSEAAAASAANLSVSDYARLERQGGGSSVSRLRPVAALVGLNGERLENIAQGWLPAPRELSTWRELRCVTTSRGGNTVHCYLVWDEVTRDAALFDTGWEADPILVLVQQEGLQLKHLFLTHLHEDHVAGMVKLREQWPKLHLHTNSGTVPPQHRNRPNDCIQLGSLRILNRATPGHAEEGVIYLVGNWPDDAPHVALVGDTIFAGSIATGFQSPDLLRRVIREQILTLPGATLLCPGHGPVTTVEEERGANPFF